MQLGGKEAGGGGGSLGNREHKQNGSCRELSTKGTIIVALTLFELYSLQRILLNKVTSQGSHRFLVAKLKTFSRPKFNIYSLFVCFITLISTHNM